MTPDSARPADAGRPVPLRLDRLSWPEALEALRRDPRMILPVGSCTQHGPHLPLGTDTIVVNSIAEEVGRRYSVLLAPTLPFGVASPYEREYAGTASLDAKTLHRVLNELVNSWERHGLAEIVLMTARGYGPHLRAIATVASEKVRVRAVDLHSIDLSRYIVAPLAAQHAGEVATALMLHVAPELVRRDFIRDRTLAPEQTRRLVMGEEPLPAEGSDGVLGRPSLASSAEGRNIHEYLVDFIGRRLYESDAEPG
jgi:creatinine amidohydrolase